MTPDLAHLSFSVDSGPLRQASPELDRMAAAAKRAEDATVRMGGASNTAADRLRKLGQATATVDGPLGGVASRFRSLGMLIRDTSVATAAFTIALGIGALAIRRFGSMATQMADAWSDMNARVGLAIGDMERSSVVMDRLATVAMRTYSSLELSTESFIRNSTVLRELGKATSEQLDFTESLNLALVVSGAKAQRAEQLQTALGRAMAAGALRGQELNTVIENGGRVAEVLAEELGVGTNQLRALGAQGLITADVIYGALTKRLVQLRDEAELMPATIGDGFLLLRNSFLQLVGTFDQQYQISQSVAESLVELSKNLNTVARSAVVAGTALLAAFGGPILAGIKTVTVAIAVGLVNAVRSLTIAMAANPLGALAGAIAIGVSWVLQFGQEIYKVGNTTVHVGNTMKALWVTVTESINIAITAVSSLADWIWNKLNLSWFGDMAKNVFETITTAATNLASSLWQFVKRNWDAAVEATKGALSDLDGAAKEAATSIMESASRISEAWQKITQIPGTDRFAFAGDMAMHLSPKAAVATPTADDSAKARRSEYERAIENIRRQTQELSAEAHVVGLSTYEKEKYLATQQLMNAALADGIEITKSLEEEIQREASALARRTAAYEAAEEAQRRLDDVRGTFQSSFSSFAQDLARGTNALDSLASALQRVADKLIDMAMNDLFENAFGKAGTGNSFFGALANGGGSGGLFGGALISGILHNGGIVGNDNTPTRAVSMAAFANAPRYHTGGIAGLRPNEVPAILERGEEVLTRRDARHRDNGGGAAPVINITNQVDASGADAANVARLEAALAKSNRDMEARVIQAIRTANKSNVKFG